MYPPHSGTATQAEDALQRALETQPVPLEEDFPDIPNFTVPPLASEIVRTIEIDPKPARPGSYAEVFKGSWIPPGATEREAIAVKIFRAPGSNTSEQGMKEHRERLHKRLAREVKIWNTLDSKLIVPLYGYTMHPPFPAYSDRPCSISPWRNRGSLMQYIYYNPQKARLPLLIQAAEAVNVLHTAEVPIVHLDVKPDNFLVNDAEDVELCDFGLSRILNGAPSGLTTSGMGPSAFQAPEYMMDGTKYSTSLDVFSFGSSILTILSGELPFKRTKSSMIIIKVMAGDKPQRDEYQIPFTASASDAIWELMNKCWDSEPDNRPTMTEVIQELRRISSLEESMTQ